LQNLRTFSANTKVHQSCLGYLVKHFTLNQETMELEKVFRQLDTSGDGFLSRDELLIGYRNLYGADFNAKEVDALFEMADSNGDGKLSYNEWMMTAVKSEIFFNE
jgi:calcium-dependent protein kinase